jgi:hypothetical protein
LAFSPCALERGRLEAHADTAGSRSHPAAGRLIAVQLSVHGDGVLSVDAEGAVRRESWTPFKAAEYAARRDFLLYTQFVDVYHSHALAREALSALRGWLGAGWCEGESGRPCRRGSRGTDRRSGANGAPRMNARARRQASRASRIGGPPSHTAATPRGAAGSSSAAEMDEPARAPQGGPFAVGGGTSMCPAAHGGAGTESKVYCGAWARPNGDSWVLACTRG